MAQVSSPPLKNFKLYKDFLLGGIASTTACLFTNPMEVVKTRLQLQGELLLSNAKPYSGVFQAFGLIVKNEGLRGIQKGLFPACLYQFTMNGTRLGTYSVLKNLIGSNENSEFSFLRNVLAGATAGVCGAVLGSPFFLVKIRMQAQSDVISIGTQYKYSSTFQAFKVIWKEGGFRGLMKGVDAAAYRVASGSSVQLPSYDFCKHMILKSGLFNDNIYAHFSASLISGVMVVLAMNPFDVVSTRIYNEEINNRGKGSLYSGPINCFIQTLKTEGIRGLYKGALAHYLRIGPHTILTFIFFEKLKQLTNHLF